MRKLYHLFLIVAFPLCAALGWYAGKSVVVENGESEVSLSSRSKMISGDRASGVDRVKSWASDLAEGKQQGPWVNAVDREAFYEEVRESLAQSHDPEADLRETIKEIQFFMDAWKGTPEEVKRFQRMKAIAGAHWERWMMVDPDAAFAAKENSSKESGMSLVGFSDSITSLHLRDRGLDETLSLLEGRKGSFPDGMRWQLASELSKRSDAGEVSRMLSSFEEGQFATRHVISPLATQWDIDRKDELLALFREDGIPASMIQTFAGRIDKKEVVPWLRELSEHENLDERARGVLASMGMRHSNGSGLSLDERIEFARELFAKAGVDQLGDTHGLKTGMVTTGMRKFLNGEDDWAYAFRHGAVGADEVLAAANEHLSEVSEHEKEVRTQLYRHLAEEDPERAMALYEGVSAEGRNWQKIYAMRWWFSNVNPEKFMNVMEEIDFEWGQEDVQKSLWEGWRKNTEGNLVRFGKDYIDWVMDLPDGIHKGRALQTLGHEGEKWYSGITSKVETELEAMRAREGGTE